MIRNKALNRSIYRREKQKILMFVSKHGENALQRIEQFSIERLKSSWVVFIVIGPNKSRHFLNQSDAKLTKNHDLVGRVFPRFSSHYLFWVFSFSSDRPL